MIQDFIGCGALDNYVQPVRWGTGQDSLCSSSGTCWTTTFHIIMHDVTILVITHHRSKAIGSLSSGLSHNLTRTVHYNKILLAIHFGRFCPGERLQSFTSVAHGAIETF